MLSRSLDRLRSGTMLSPPVLAFVGVVVLAQLLAAGGAVAGLPALWAVGALGVGLDLYGHSVPNVRALAANAQITLVARAVVRELGLILLLVQLVPGSPVVLLSAAAVPLARGALLFVTPPARQLLRAKMSSRGLDVPLVGGPPVPIPTVPVAVGASSVVLPGAVVGFAWGVWWPFVVTAILYSGTCLVVAAVLGVASVRRHRRPVSLQYHDEAKRALDRLRPRVVLYFAGNAASAYQANMWLPVLERLDHQAVVLFRSAAAFEELAPTSIPAVCIPSSVDLMNFRMPTVRVSFVVAHNGNNIHILREPRIKHVFIGHGESDKVASVNPITKGYDEIWVAGPASRRRWHQARVGVHDDTIVEVGRPQLGGIEPAGDRSPADPLTVLYAPTWEGWIQSAENASSVADLGVAMVRWLLARPDTRVVYKPHPLTGTVSGAARRAHEEMVRLVHAAPRSGSVVGPGGPSLYDCFNTSDVLIGDISSVIPDYLASGKPYLVPNPHGSAHDAMRAELASTRGGYILDPDPDGWEQVLTTAVGDDPLRQARQELRLDILGPRHEDPVQPWRDAVTSLIDRADREWPDATAEAREMPE